MRDDLNRFLFTANDIVVAVGQDGLVANLAKYLNGQPVVGISPDPALTEGILTGTQIAPTEDRAAFFAREPGPSRISGAAISAGEIGPDAPLSVLSQLNEGGVIFADGIEQDFLPFNWGVRAEIGMANQKLRMVAA